MVEDNLHSLQETSIHLGIIMLNRVMLCIPIIMFSTYMDVALLKLLVWPHRVELMQGT